MPPWQVRPGLPRTEGTSRAVQARGAELLDQGRAPSHREALEAVEREDVASTGCEAAEGAHFSIQMPGRSWGTGPKEAGVLGLVPCRIWKGPRSRFHRAPLLRSRSSVAKPGGLGSTQRGRMTERSLHRWRMCWRVGGWWPVSADAGGAVTHVPAPAVVALGATEY